MKLSGSKLGAGRRFRRREQISEVFSRPRSEFAEKLELIRKML